MKKMSLLTCLPPVSYSIRPSVGCSMSIESMMSFRRAFVGVLLDREEAFAWLVGLVVGADNINSLI